MTFRLNQHTSLQETVFKMSNVFLTEQFFLKKAENTTTTTVLSAICIIFAVNVFRPVIRATEGRTKKEGKQQ